MRVICLVPSLTETLIEAGVDVVARTSFCIHPANKVKSIPAIGGTKSVDWNKLPPADLVIFDKEENTKQMAATCPLPWEAFHVDSLESLEHCFARLYKVTKLNPFYQWEKETQELRSRPIVKQSNLNNFPGIINKNKFFGQQTKLRYLIWSKPFMEVSRQTFIGDMLCQLGYEDFVLSTAQSKYPKIEVELTEDNFPDTALLLSSEPYPFAKEWQEKWRDSSLPLALIDGESFSWFGIRALNFLKKSKEA